MHLLIMRMVIIIEFRVVRVRTLQWQHCIFQQHQVCQTTIERSDTMLISIRVIKENNEKRPFYFYCELRLVI